MWSSSEIFSLTNINCVCFFFFKATVKPRFSSLGGMNLCVLSVFVSLVRFGC